MRISGFSVVFALVLASPAWGATTVAPETLATAITERAQRVEEFREIVGMARNRSVRVWLFGGTAASFAHYVKLDLLREGGDPSLQADRFDYSFMNIFRSSQDLDIVVDAPPDVIQGFQSFLEQRFAYFAGNKRRWEVRALRHAIGDKEALLENPDFLNQHTDSHSTGMIELTAARSGEPAVRDLRDWSSPAPQFLRDVAEGRLHYYFSKRHETTPRFRAGKNPPILSAIRFLIKAFQFELEIRPEDRAAIEAVISDFTPEILPQYVRGWLEEHAPKLFKNAVDIAYAWNTLEDLGLRQKLLRAAAAANIPGLATWMKKEPLRDSPDPRRLLPKSQSGKTAGELGIEIVAHETRDFLTWEAIRRSHKGIPDVFISRQGGDGENAAFGNGFYTQIGKTGATGSGFHIRMKVHPSAVEGVDFFRAGGTYVVWLTRDKLEVIQESLVFSPQEALDFLFDPQTLTERGIREMFRRKLSYVIASPEAQKDFEDRIEALLANPDHHRDILLTILDHEPLRKSMSHEKVLGWAARILDGPNQGKMMMPSPGAWLLDHSKWAYWTVRNVEEELNAPGSSHGNVDHGKWRVRLAQNTLNLRQGAGLIWELRQQELIRELLDRNKANFDQALAEHVISEPAVMRLEGWPVWFKILLDRGNADRQLIEKVLPKAAEAGVPRIGPWMQRIVRSRAAQYPDAIAFALAQSREFEADARFGGWVETLIRGQGAIRPLVDGILTDEAVAHHPVWGKSWPKWVRLAVQTWEPAAMPVLAEILKRPSLFSGPGRRKLWAESVEWLITHRPQFADVYAELLNSSQAMANPRWKTLVEKLVRAGSSWVQADINVARLLIAMKGTVRPERWKRWFLDFVRGGAESGVVKMYFPDEGCEAHLLSAGSKEAR